MTTEEININDIYSDPDFNCRGPIAPIDVVELVRSIESNGLQQPVVVERYTHDKYKYRLIMGHRRHKAFELLSRTNPKYLLIPAMVSDIHDEAQKRTLNLIENLERKDLTIMQEARAVEKLHKLHVKEEDIGRRLNKSRGWVQIRLAALKLSPEIQAEIEAGFVSQEQIRDLHKIPSETRRLAVVKEIKEQKERGEKKRAKIVDPKPKPVVEKKIRLQSEMFEMQDRIREMVGNNLTTRTIGWCAGIVSTTDLEVDLKAYAEEIGRIYIQRPEHII